MSPLLRRTTGYLLPTLVVVAGIHLAREASFGEALDGVLSALWFVALFALGSLASARGLHAERGRMEPVREGLLLALATWLALWAFWSVPQSQPMLAKAGGPFVWNSVASLAAGLVRLPRARDRHALTV